MKKILMTILSVGMLISANMLNLSATAQGDTQLILTAHDTAVQTLTDNQAVIDDLNSYANAFPEVAAQVDETELTTYVTEFMNKKAAAEQAAQNITTAISTYQKALDVFNASGSAASNSPQEAAGPIDYATKINMYFMELDEWLEASKTVYENEVDYSKLIAVTEKMNTFFEETATTLAAYRDETININTLYVAPYTVGTEVREQADAEGMCSIFTRTDISEVVEMLSNYPTAAPATLHGFADPMQDELNARSVEYQQTMAEYKEQIDKYNSTNTEAPIDYFYPPENVKNVLLNIASFNAQYRDLHYQSMKIDGVYPATPSTFYETAFYTNYESNAPGIQDTLEKFDDQKAETIAMLQSLGCIDDNQNFIDNSRAVGRALTNDDILLFNFMYRSTIGYSALHLTGRATFRPIKFTVPVQTGNDKVVVPTVIVPTLNKPIPLFIPTKSVANTSEAGQNNSSVKNGDNITYEITYGNTGNLAANIEIVDTLIAGVTFIQASDNGVYDEMARTITWNLANVAASTTGSVLLEVQVNEQAIDKVTNIASVSLDGGVAITTNIVENLLDNETTITIDPDLDPTLPSTGEGSKEIIILSTLLVLGSSVILSVGRRKMQAY